MNLALIFACLPLLGAAAIRTGLLPPQQECQARLVVRQQGDMLAVVGQCLNVSSQPLNLSYELKMDKTGSAGTSRNSQSGRFTIASHQTLALSQTTIRVDPTDYYRVRLRLLDEQGRIVAQDSLLYTPKGKP
ncbi:curli-like amyloid fiber formation chaperone CsgH [Hymenobacter algoricola]|uniref:curli-like amyloid fiber formation chaperone CsgH n=1 Tax=Hymenobacter algoricola TaxID=486267 RepID=UPI003CD09F35